MSQDKVTYRDEHYTAYGEEYDILTIGPAVYPRERTTSANGRLSYRNGIAHGIVGHRETHFQGRANVVGC